MLLIQIHRRAYDGTKRLLRVGILLALLPFAGPLIQAQTEPIYDIAVAKDVMVSMRDGVKLATDIYRPARNGAPGDGKFPAILMRTPYNKAERAASPGPYSAARGYVVVVQDVRGRYKS